MSYSDIRITVYGAHVLHIPQHLRSHQTTNLSPYRDTIVPGVESLVKRTHVATVRPVDDNGQTKGSEGK